MTNIVRRAHGITIRIQCEIYELRRREVDVEKFLENEGVDLCDPADEESSTKDIYAVWTEQSRMGLGRWMTTIGAPMLSCSRASWWTDFEAEELRAKASFGYSHGSAAAVIEVDTMEPGSKLERIQAILNELPYAG